MGFGCYEAAAGPALKRTRNGGQLEACDVHKVRKLVWVLWVPAILSVALFAQRILFSSSSHVGFEPYYFLGASLLAGVACVSPSKRMRLAAVALASLNALIVVFAVHFNQVVQYEDWVKRGMPEKPALRDLL